MVGRDKTMSPTTETAGDQLYDVSERIYDRQREYLEVSPISLAREGMQAIDFPLRLHPLGHIGCELHLRQIARSSKTSRSFLPAAGLKEARKRSVNLGTVRTFFADPLRTRQEGPQ
jgi:hypothetical protein